MKKKWCGQLAWLLIAALVSTSSVFGQDTRPRILVPETPKVAEKRKEDGPRTARPELVLQTGVTVPAAIAAYSPDGRLVASMSFQGGAVKLWEVITGRELYNLNLGARGATTTSLNSAFTFNADGKTLISLSAGKIKEWDTETGRELRSIDLNNGGDFAGAAFSADGRLLVTITQTKAALTVWDTRTGRSLQKLVFDINGSQFIHAYALSPDGRVLATGEESRKGGGDSTSLVLRDLASWRVLQTIKVTEEKMGRPSLSEPIKSSESVRAIRFTPDSQTVGLAIRDVTWEQPVATVGATRFVRQDNLIKFWDVTSGREQRSIPVSTSAGKAPMAGMAEFYNGAGLVFSHDGKLFAAVSNDQNVKLFETSTGKHFSTIVGHDGMVTSIAFATDDKHAVTAGFDKTIRIWDVSTTASTGRAALVRTFGEGAMPVVSLAYAVDGRTLAVSAAESVSLWELNTGASRRTIELSSNSLKGPEDLFSHRSSSFFSQTGQYVAARVDSGDVKVWETQSGREVQTLKVQEGKTLDGGALSLDGKLIALPGHVSQAIQSASANPAPSGQVQAPATSIPVPQPTDPRANPKADPKADKKRAKEEKQQQDALKQMEKLSKSGQMPAGLGDMSQLTKMMEAAQRGEMGKVQEMMGEVMGSLPQAMGGGNQSATGVRLFDVAGGTEIRSVGGSRSLVASNRAPVALSGDGRIIASATGGPRIKIHEVATGRELFNVSADRAMIIDQIALSPDGRFLAAAMMETKAGINITQVNSETSFEGFYSFSVKLWDLSNPGTGAREARNLSGHTGNIGALAFSPDGSRLASGGFDATVRLWEVATGRELGVLSGHSLAVTALGFSGDGKQLVSGSDDGSTRLWQTDTGETLATLVTFNHGADWLVVTPDGLFDGTPGAWSQLLWRFSPNIYDVTPVEVFFNEFYYPGLLSAIASSGTRPRAAQDVSQKDRRQPLVLLSRTDGQADGPSVSTRTIKVRLEVSAPPSKEAAGGRAVASDVRLFRNGTLVKVWRGDVLKGQNQVALETSVPIVAGENRLTAYAFNRDNVKSVDATLLVTGAPALQRKGTAYILAFGINRYANEQYNLKYAVADATSFAEELRSQQAKLGQYERVEVITLSDAEATKANILLALKSLSSESSAKLPPDLEKIKPAQPEDAVIIYFAGHGTARGPRFYLVPHDLGYTGSRTAINAEAVDTILARSISDLELETAIEGLDAEKLFLVIDACNSGQALEAEEKRRGPMNSKGLAQLAYEKGIYILTAAQSYQAALEAAELGHGYLTYALVEEGLKRGLADRDLKDGQVLAREWFNYATDRVPQMQERAMTSRLLLFVEGDEKIKDPAKRSVQRPRVFYRREVEASPLIVAKP